MLICRRHNLHYLGGTGSVSRLAREAGKVVVIGAVVGLTVLDACYTITSKLIYIEK
jgi:hypothetical protein